MDSKKTTQRNIEVSEGSFIDELPHGRRSAYVRSVINAHLNSLEESFGSLREYYSEVEIFDLIEQAEKPWKELAAWAGLRALPTEHRQAVADLAAEVERTGIAKKRLIELLTIGSKV